MTTTGGSLVELSKSLAERMAVKPVPGGEKAFTDSVIAQLRADGAVAALVPKDFGGPGLSVGDAARITFHVARVSGSAGLIYAMHLSQALSVVRHGRGPLFEDFMRRMVRDQILIASGTSEKGPGGDIFTSLCAVEPLADGEMQIRKESPNISYVDHAGAILVSANHGVGPGKPRQVLVLGEADRTEFVPGYDSSLLGMKGILNKSYRFTSRFSADAIFPDSFGVIARRTMTPSIHIFWAALWSGIAWAVLDKARAFATKELPREGDVSAVVRLDLSRLANRHFMMNVLIRDAIASFDVQEAGPELGLGTQAALNRLKICCSELLEEICLGALKVIGIRGYAAAGPYALAEPFADAFSASIMVSNTRLALSNSKLENFVDHML